MARHDPLHNPGPLIREVYAYVAYRIGRGADAEDITSEVFERALRYRQNFDPAKGTPIEWLIGIARRCISGRTTIATTHADGLDEPATPNLEEATLRKLSLSEAVSQLGERDRELIALRYGADLSARQIGEQLSLTPNAVDVALHRAIERLRQAFDAL
jgi:RNA polymerase sigma factor (sigma-70 family)